jgi:hypothetical protein
MPLLAAAIQALFTALGAFLLKLFLARLAIRVVAVTAIIAAGAALMALYNSTVTPLVAQAFSSSYGQVLGLAFPPIAGTCLAAVAAVWSACGLYTLNRRAIMVTSGV